jgi:hypothetical protein
MRPGMACGEFPGELRIAIIEMADNDENHRTKKDLKAYYSQPGPQTQSHICH